MIFIVFQEFLSRIIFLRLRCTNIPTIFLQYRGIYIELLKLSVYDSIRAFRSSRQINSRLARAKSRRKFNFPRVENNPCLGNWLLVLSSWSLPFRLLHHDLLWNGITWKEIPTRRGIHHRRATAALLLIRPATWNKIKRILKLARANFLAFPSTIFVSPRSFTPPGSLNRPSPPSSSCRTFIPLSPS